MRVSTYRYNGRDQMLGAMAMKGSDHYVIDHNPLRHGAPRATA